MCAKILVLVKQNKGETYSVHRHKLWKEGNITMGDIKCAKCAEPWDAYGVDHGDMTCMGAHKFHHGQGCPSCHWGTECVSCGGTGLEREQYGNQCQTCMGQHKVLARRLLSDSKGVWRYGYIPNVRQVPVEYEEGLMRELRPVRESRDGPFVEAWFRCWSCQGNPCQWCKGDGKLHVGNPEEVELDAARSAVEESDKEPVGILERRGLL